MVVQEALAVVLTQVGLALLVLAHQVLMRVEVVEVVAVLMSPFLMLHLEA
jgi:hypothetical protein